MLLLPLQRLDFLQRARVNVLGLFLLLDLPVGVAVTAAAPRTPGAVGPGGRRTALVRRSG